MAHFLPLALLISAAASAIIIGPGGAVIARPAITAGPTTSTDEFLTTLSKTPTPCSLQTIPTNSPAWNIPTYCKCGVAGAYPATTPAASLAQGPTCPTMGNLFSNGEVMSPISPAPFTCNLESATSGFTVPNRWCGCTAGTSTSTYSTKFGAPSAPAACNFMQDELPAGTISPTAAHCVVASALPGGTFYDQLAWCACGDNAPHPLIPSPSAPCAYTTVPSSTITPRPIASTSCQLLSLGNATTSFCECDGAGTSARYPSSTGSEPCVFSTVPTATLAVPTAPPSLIGKQGAPACSNPGGCFSCDLDGQTIVALPNAPPTAPPPSYIWWGTCPQGSKCPLNPGALVNTRPDCVPA